MSATDSTTSAKSVAPDDSFFAKNGTYICFALRLLLCFGFVSRTTQWFHTASALSFLRDPTWTMEQVEESIALKILSQNATVWDSYASGTVHMPVLVLLLLEQLARLPSSVVPILLGIFLSIIDALIGNFLQKNAEFLQKRDYEEEHRIQKLMPDELKPPHEALFHAKDGDEEPLLAPMNALPQWVSQIYFYSPATIISSACLQCMHNVPVLCLLGALHTVLHGSTILAGIILALSAYMDIHNVVFLGPLILLARERKKSGAPLVVGFLLINVCMQVATVLLVGSDRYWQVLNATHLHSFVVVGMSPNLSPLWYLGMELFDRFHLYSTILVGCMPYITLLSIYTRLWRYPGSMVRKRQSASRQQSNTFCRWPSCGSCMCSSDLQVRCMD